MTVHLAPLRRAPLPEGFHSPNALEYSTQAPAPDGCLGALECRYTKVEQAFKVETNLFDQSKKTRSAGAAVACLYPEDFIFPGGLKPLRLGYYAQKPNGDYTSWMISTEWTGGMETAQIVPPQLHVVVKSTTRTSGLVQNKVDWARWFDVPTNALTQWSILRVDCSFEGEDFLVTVDYAGHRYVYKVFTKELFPGAPTYAWCAGNFSAADIGGPGTVLPTPTTCYYTDFGVRQELEEEEEPPVDEPTEWHVPGTLDKYETIFAHTMDEGKKNTSECRVLRVYFTDPDGNKKEHYYKKANLWPDKE